jgi:hypothetical protein
MWIPIPLEFLDLNPEGGGSTLYRDFTPALTCDFPNEALNTIIYETQHSPSGRDG